jgi:hypothetical protein
MFLMFVGERLVRGRTSAFVITIKVSTVVTPAENKQ